MISKNSNPKSQWKIIFNVESLTLLRVYVQLDGSNAVGADGGNSEMLGCFLLQVKKKNTLKRPEGMVA